MGRRFLSRHFLSEQANCVAALPSAPAGAPNDSGLSTSHNLLALGTWSEEAQEHHLTVADLAVTHRGDEVAGAPTVARLAAFDHPGRVAALRVADLGGGEVVLVTASAAGCLTRLRLSVPLAPGSVPEGIQLQGEDFEGAALLPWLEAAPGAGGGVAALDVSTDRRLAAASGSGALCVASLAAPAGDALLPAHSSCGGTTFTGVKWASPHVLATTSLQGLLQVWDARATGGASQKPALQQQAMLRRSGGGGGGGGPEGLTAVEVHPAQPHLCVTGGEGGAVSSWDLRVGGGAAAPASSFAAGSAVHALQYDGGGGLAYGTARGAVGLVPARGAAPRLLYQEPTAAIRGLSCGGGATPFPALFAVADSESMVFLANAM